MEIRRPLRVFGQKGRSAELSARRWTAVIIIALCPGESFGIKIKRTTHGRACLSETRHDNVNGIYIIINIQTHLVHTDDTAKIVYVTHAQSDGHCYQ